MDQLDILLTRDFEPELLDCIRAVDPRVTVHVLTQPDRLLLRGEPLPEGADPRETADTLRTKLASTRILVGWPDLTEAWLACAPELEWVHTTGAGVDRLLTSSLFGVERITVTNSSGVSAAAIGEYILMSMLLLAKLAPRYLRQQQTHLWQRHRGASLRGQTLGIIGLGAIGEEAARRARAFEMRVIGIRRSVSSPSAGEFVDRLLPPSSLPELLGESDHIVVSVPLTAETQRLIGEQELRAMKPSAYLINVARGRVVDPAALLRALQGGWIAGAALDVHDPEPLPPESPFWDLENVIITPHISGSADRHNERITDLFCDNLRRYLAGEPLRNVVDRSKGY